LPGDGFCPVAALAAGVAETKGAGSGAATGVGTASGTAVTTGGAAGATSPVDAIGCAPGDVTIRRTINVPPTTSATASTAATAMANPLPLPACGSDVCPHDATVPPRAGSPSWSEDGGKATALADNPAAEITRDARSAEARARFGPKGTSAIASSATFE
jgi:hypothetical protein